MKKKVALVCALVMLVMSFSQSVGAINVIMNSSYVSFPDQEPVVENGVTLVPLRAIAEMLGLEVSWDDPTDTVVLKKDNFYIELVIGSTTAKTSSGTKKLDVAPKIINGRTMVPLRFIAEELGLTVSWNQEYQRVVINGQVETQNIAVLPPEKEEASEASVLEEDALENETNVEEAEEETDVFDSGEVSFSSPSATLTIYVPQSFEIEDSESEESFAYRSLDACDTQHLYNWEVVTLYESYADDSGKNGIIIIVQEMEPYEGEVYDVSRIMDEYPEAPQQPQIDWGYVYSELNRIIVEQICIEKEIEVPEGYEEMDDETLALALGFESEDEMSEYLSGMDTQELMNQIPEYVEYMDYRYVYSEYREEVSAIDNARAYAVRNFSSVSGELDDEVWAEFFSSHLNTDEEVRYENVEIIDYNGKKIVHGVIYAEDPDDEQGTYEYYYFIDGDTAITIYGGTLYGSEPSQEAADALANMTVE